MLKRFISVRLFAVPPRWFAGVTASGVFLVLYFGEGLRLFGGHSWWYVLIWMWETGNWRLVFNLGSFALVSLFVYRLTRVALSFAGDRLRVRTLEDEIAGLRDQAAELAGARESLARCREELRAAAEARREAERRGTAGGSSSGPEEKFQAAKRAFARLFHPDNVKAEGFDKLIRAEIFKEFWRELEAIEKSGKR